MFKIIIFVINKATTSEQNINLAFKESESICNDSTLVNCTNCGELINVFKKDEKNEISVAGLYFCSECNDYSKSY